MQGKPSYQNLIRRQARRQDEPNPPHDWFVIRATHGGYAAVRGEPGRLVYFSSYTRSSCISWMQFQDERHQEAKNLAKAIFSAALLTALVVMVAQGAGAGIVP